MHGDLGRTVGAFLFDRTLASSRIFFAWLDVVPSILFPLFLLDHLDVSLHDGLLVRVILLCSRAEAVPRDFLHDLRFPFQIVGTASRDVETSLRRVGNHFPDVLALASTCSAESLSAACAKDSSLFSCSTRTSASFMHRDMTAAKLVSCGQEAFAGIAFAKKRFMLITELIPECMKCFVVGTMDIVAQST